MSEPTPFDWTQSEATPSEATQSELTQTLEHISRRVFQSEAPLARRFEAMPPGLTRAEIEAQVQGFPFVLPQEFYDLYAWHNGGAIEMSYFSRIYSLEEALALYQTYCQTRETFDPHLFPVMEINDEPGVVVCLKGEDTPVDCSPILEWRAETAEPAIWYGRLTDLMQAMSGILD